MNSNPLRKFLWYCAAADIKTLSTYGDEKDRNKYESIGGAILAVTIYAILTGGYAAGIVFGSLAVIPIGLFWGFTIFTLDRFFIQNISSESEGFKGALINLATFLLRIAIALVLSLVLAEPVKLAIFGGQIKERIESDKKERIISEEKRLLSNDPQIKSYQDKKLALRQSLKDQKLIVEKANNEYNRELDGSGGTGQRGDGAIARARLELLDKEEVKLREIEKSNKIEIPNIDADIQKVIENKISPIRNSQNTVQNTLLLQITTFHKLTKENQIIQYTNILLSVLFGLLEISPIIIKAMSSKDGAYESALVEITNQKKKEMKAPIRLKISEQMNSKDRNSKLQEIVNLKNEEIKIKEEELEAEKILARLNRAIDKEKEIIDKNHLNQKPSLSAPQSKKQDKPKSEYNTGTQINDKKQTKSNSKVDTKLYPKDNLKSKTTSTDIPNVEDTITISTGKFDVKTRLLLVQLANDITSNVIQKAISLKPQRISMTEFDLIFMDLVNKRGTNDRYLQRIMSNILEIAYLGCIGFEENEIFLPDLGRGMLSTEEELKVRVENLREASLILKERLSKSNA